MDTKKRDSMIKIFKFGVWAGGMGFILALFSVVFFLVDGRGIGLTDLFNVGITLFAFVYFRQGLRKLRDQKE
ncbi:hypothetical protein [Desulfuribacillus alkaliarsenatis]|uniref:Uncharacterized protein n=1 Tax=Desulfuribacillus alkaliarsenatis TaxID=766136 RepID=A0A1E5FYZ4_9FIRM|nr:hypothetical protein [Desulfuribacillus alkaliarsenatis]OEF95721.1 hypothetical protein BHF68_11490 [Desulfuribacillus alkaliarsenatis]